MEEESSGNLPNGDCNNSNVANTSTATNIQQFIKVNTNGQIKLVSLNDVKNYMGLQNRVVASSSDNSSSMNQQSNNINLTINGGTNQIMQLQNKSPAFRLPATSQIQYSQVRQQPINSGNAFQIVGSDSQLLKPGSSIQLVQGQAPQIGTIQLGPGQTLQLGSNQTFQLGSGQAVQTFQVVNTPINADQVVMTGGQTFQLQIPQQQQLSQLTRFPGNNQSIRFPIKSPNGNLVINTSGNVIGNVNANVSNTATPVKPSMSGGVTFNTPRQQLVQLAVNTPQQMTLIRPNASLSNDGSTTNVMTSYRSITPQQFQQQKRLVLISNSSSQTPTSSSVSTSLLSGKMIQFPQQILVGQQQVTAGTPMRYIAVRNNAPNAIQVGGSGQTQQLTFSLLAPNQQRKDQSIPTKDMQDILQKMKGNTTTAKVIAPALGQQQTRYILQAGSSSNTGQTAIQMVDSRGTNDSYIILSKSPSGATLASLSSDDKNSASLLKSRVLAIRGASNSQIGQGSATSTRAAMKSNKIIEQAVAKAQAGGIEIEVTESDGKKKWKRKADFDDGSEPNKKKNRNVRPKAGGSADDPQDGDADENVDSDSKTDRMSNLKAFSKSLKKKKKPLPSFVSKKKKKKDGQESDASDSGMMDAIGPPSPYLDGQDETGAQVTTRRSGRVIQRKKYVDELDLGITDEEANEEVISRKKASAAASTSRLPPTPSVVDRSQDSQDGSIMESTAEDDGSSQIVDKILGMRIAKREFEVPDDEDDEDNLEIIEGRTVKLVDVEEFFVKYKNYSYLHCDWKTADELLVGDKRILMKIKRFKLKKSQSYMQDEEEEDLFNPDYAEVDRVLDMATSTDPETDEVVTHYLVTWKSLAYEDATWELEKHVDPAKIDAYLERKDRPTDETNRFKSRPHSKEWTQMNKEREYKNGNTLREYQLEGLNWLSFSYYHRQNCILADEMGLGKTIQSITFLQDVFDYGIHGPFLVVVPLSTIGNWQREFEAWTNLNVIVYHGSHPSRNMLKKYEMYYYDDPTKKVPNIYKFHALVTTFECVLADKDELSLIKWRVAVIDEAHRLKNRNCKLLQGLGQFTLEHRVLLTGTPLQNNVDELFSLLSFLEPKQFSSADAFMAEFGRLETESQVGKLKALLKPMMLRRLKEDVEKNLAPKEETIVEVELTNIQKKYYRAILERNYLFLSKGSNSANVPNLMNTMMELRKCCNHPYLINGAEDQILSDLRIDRTDMEHHFQALVTSSGKLVLVDKLLPKLKANGHKVLIFSQMIRVLDILEDYLIHKKYLYERIDGRIRGNLRQEAIDRFSKPESDRFVFLLCTRAGGLGINLTAADTVIIFDSDWNPQNDLQAQARCHRIGQMKAVKVYRLITRNTYEREMFDKASLKLGLDKAVLQSMGNKEMNVQGQLSKKEIEDLLKRGAYGALMEDDNAGEKFCEEDIEQILQRRTQVIQIESGVKGSTFAKASFNMSSNRTDIDVDDPNFWQKWAKKAEIDVDNAKGKTNLIMDLPRQRKTTARYGKQDNIVNMSDLDTSNSDTDYAIDSSDEVEGKRGRKRKRGSSKWDRDEYDRLYTRSDCFKVEKTLLVYGWGRWKDILDHARFKHKLSVDDVITIARAMLLFSLHHYEGDEKIKKFIFDLISPEDGTEKDYRNHSGLSAPVPRGRKGKKLKKDGVRKFEDDLTKLDIDVDSILSDEGYRKHLKRQSNKVLLRVRLLYYLKQEVIGRNAEQILDGADVNDINLPILCTDGDLPVFWWDDDADRSLLIGVFKHGYEKYNLMRNDPCLCFLQRCGPPDDRAVLAEQNSDADELKEDDDDEEQKPKKRGRKRKKFKKFRGGDEDDDYVSYDYRGSRGLSTSGSGTMLENGKFPFPGFSDLNGRFRRIITSLQRCHKQGMLKLEQVAKKLHKREQMKDSKEGEIQYVSPNHLKSVRLESVGDNPLRLAEQLSWTRREETEFYRVVTSYGVERERDTGNFIWDTFRTLARLERKNDDTLTEYFKSFYHMCMRVCRRFETEDEARPPNGVMLVHSISEERANRSLVRIDLLNRIREGVLFNEKLEERLQLCMPASYLPSWWICGQHDKDLLIGAAKHGLSHTFENILFDPNLSFYKYASQSHDETGEFMKDEHNPDSNPGSPGGSGEVVKKEVKTIKIEEIKKEENHVDESQKSEVTDSIVVGKDVCVEDVKEENDVDNKDDVSGLQSTITEEENVNDSSRMYNRWPKDRHIISRLENICYCIESGKWSSGHRQHRSLYMEGFPYEKQSIPTTPSGGHDYTLIHNSVDELEGLKFRLQKKRYRRSKAEIEAEKIRRNYNNNNSDSELMGGEGQNEEDYSMRSFQLKAKKQRSGDGSTLRIPVLNTINGTRLTGEDAPTLHELDSWLEMHPNYVVEKEKHGCRKARLDPSKLSIQDLTGEENVTVINRNTGKRISGIKAPVLMNLAEWLVKNPGFDVDARWFNVIKQLHYFPKELFSRVQDPASKQTLSSYNNLLVNSSSLLLPPTHFSEVSPSAIPSTLPRIIHHPKNISQASTSSINQLSGSSAIQNIKNFGDHFFAQGSHQANVNVPKQQTVRRQVCDTNSLELQVGEEDMEEEIVEEEVDYDEEDDVLRCDDDEDDDDDDDEGSTAPEEDNDVVE